MIPAIFPPGFVSIYGSGSTQGFTLQQEYYRDYTFGLINQVTDEQGAYSLGQSVLFPFKQGVPVIYGGITYYIIDQSKIVLSENPIIIEPEP